MHQWCNTSYWDYLSQPQKDLIREGSYLYQEIFSDGKYSFQDYSFIVFPFAKAYEGFLKQVLFDIRYISESEYHSNHIRLGKLLSPDLSLRFPEESLYLRIRQSYGEIADTIWETWKYSRNQVFHYYPHNQRSLNLIEAKERIEAIINTMTATFSTILQNKCPAR